jgi:SHS2 domain-containing protein
MMKKNYIFLEHTADIKFRAFGASLEQAFENVVLAFSRYVSANEKLKANKKKTIELKATDNESLLYAFIDELIYLLDAEHFAVMTAQVKIEGGKLKAKLAGVNTKGLRLNHVKAATYAEMYVRKVRYGSQEAWEAQAVIDV